MTVPNKSRLPPGEGQGEGHNLLTDNLPLLAGAPNGIKKLRELILELAVRGKLVPQDPSDEPASELLKRIAEEKAQLVAEGKIKKQKPLPEVSDESKQFDLPAGWEWARLGSQVLESGAGWSPSCESRPREGSEWGVLKVSAVSWGIFRPEENKALPANLDARPEHEVSEGDFLVSRANTEELVARSVVVEATPSNLMLSDKIVRLKLTSFCERRYVNLVNSAPLARAYYSQVAGGTSSSMKNVSREQILNLPLALPPLAEQHRIVAKVDELMALCDRLEARQADADSAHTQLVQALLDSLTQARDAEDFAQSWQRLVEHFHTLFTTESSIDALKQTLLQLAVMGKLVPQDPSDEPASELLKRIAEEKATLIAEGKIRKQKQLAEINEEEKLFELATGWEWSRLGEQVIESGAGWSPSCEPRPRERNDWGVLKVSAVSWGIYRPEENKALPVNLEARPEHEVAEGDFLVSRANTAELVARSVVVDSTPSRLMLSDKIVRLRLTKLCDAHYLNLVNSATHARQYYARVAGGTSSSMKNVSREQILSLPIAVPPLPEQHRIVAKVDQLMALCDQLKTRLNQARQVHEQLANALVEQAVA